MKGDLFLDALAEAMSVKRKVAKTFMGALEHLLVKELRETGAAKIPRVIAVKRAMRTARPEQVRKVFGQVKRIAARPQTVLYRATPAKQLRDQL